MRLNPVIYNAIALGFQSTHPRGVRHTMGAATPKMYRFQSTHPRGVRRAEDVGQRRKPPISIHAPTWGATNPADSAIAGLGISIHAPTWGATAPSASSIVRGAFQSTHPRGVRRYDDDGARRGFIFQSTHPRGVRHKNRARGGGDNPISIHAPTWGATAAWDRLSEDHKFQSTHPRGVRPLTVCM